MPRFALSFAAGIILIHITVFSLYAQEAASGEDWFVPGTLPVQDQLLYAQAALPELQSKLSVLDTLYGRARSGGISPADRNILFILRHIALESTKARSTAGKTPANRDFPEARRASCEVLGYIGGERSVQILLDVLRFDDEPMVLSDALSALAKTAFFIDSDIIEVLTRILEKKILVSHDAHLTYAFIFALDRLCAAPPGIRDERIFLGLLKFLDGPFPLIIKNRAKLIVEKLKNFERGEE